MSETQERQAPVWHAIVGEGYEPVQIGEMTEPNDDMLRAGGWVCANGGGGLTYREDWTPRRRRKKPDIRVRVTGENNGLPYEHIYLIKPGKNYTFNDDGTIVSLGPSCGRTIWLSDADPAAEGDSP